MEFKQTFKEYAISKMGELEGNLAFNFSDFGDKDYMAMKAGEELKENYDLGIGLANGGLWLSYIFDSNGLPVKIVDCGRKGRGASWKPIDVLDNSVLEDKKIIIFDDDVLLGRTLNRAVKEIKKYSPKFMDLLLVHEKTCLTLEKYKQWKDKYNLSDIEEIYSRLNIKKVTELSKGLEISHLRPEESFTRDFFIGNNELVWLNCRKKVPKEINKVMTLDKDFGLK